MFRRAIERRGGIAPTAKSTLPGWLGGAITEAPRHDIMKPKFIYTNKADIPAALAEFYKEDNGVFALDVEGAVAANRLAEFRETNIKLAKQLSLFTGVNGDDPDLETKVKEYAELKAKRATYEGVKEQDRDKLDKLLAERVGTMKAEHEAALKKNTDELGTLKNKLQTVMIDKAAVEACVKHGLRDTAHDDVIFRARQHWVLDGDKIVAKDREGKTIYGPNGEPLTVDEWAADLTKKAPHIFAENKGGGSPGPGKGGSGGGGGANPWVKGESWNLTKQGEMLKSDPTTARRLAAQAGVTLPGA